MFTGEETMLRTRAPADAKTNDLAFIEIPLLRGFPLNGLQVERAYVVVIRERDFGAGHFNGLAQVRNDLRVLILRGGAPDLEQAVAVGEDADRGLFLQDADLRAISVRRTRAAGNALGFVAGDVDDLAGVR